MAKCQTCGDSGANMKTCEACLRIWCSNCVNTGKWPAVRRPRSSNECPYCGKVGKVKVAK